MNTEHLKPHRGETNYSIMNKQEKQSFLTFIKILADTGNMLHAIEESGWANSHDTDDQDLPLVDLTKIPRSQWSDYVASSVTLPPAINLYVKNCDEPLSVAERHSIGEALEKYYQTDPGYCIIDTNEGDFYLAES